MNRYKFKDYPHIDSLFIEFESSTKYIHSVRKVNDKFSSRIEPYEPSIFIYSFFTFNSLYNIDWKETVKNNYKNITYNDGSERDRINDYIDFLWAENQETDIIKVFNYTLTKVIRQYLTTKGADDTLTNIPIWIQTNMSGFIYSSGEDIPQEKKFSKNQIYKFERILRNSFERGELDCQNMKHLAQIIYSVRCNLFHGAKDPEFFEENHQMERFVIYGAILTTINQLLFSTIHRQLSRCAH